MKPFAKKMITFGIIGCMTVPMLAAFTACKSDPNTFTIWMGANAGVSENYTDMNENPVIKYLEYKFDIDLEFSVPVMNTERSVFQTLVQDNTPDVMELSYYDGAVVDLVEDGVAVDLTEYIYPKEGESLFPYTKAFLDANPDVKNDVRTLDDHYYALYTATDPEGNPPWGGYMYRKDLLYKYATAADQEGEADPATWTSKEDIVFPSGADAPDLISDYDWLFAILKRAVDAGELNYVTTLYYPGYLETGEIVSAFGAGADFYKTTENGKTVVKYGANSDEFKAYLAKMKEWWDKGYIDKQFTDHKNDMFFAIDSKSYTVGKVGCLYGMTGFLGDSLYRASLNSSLAGTIPATMDLRAAYMPRLSKEMEPIHFYKDERISRRWMVTDTAMGKNYEKLFKALDYLYSEQGSLMLVAGLSKEQYAEMIDAGVTGFWDPTITLNAEEKETLGISADTAKLSEIGAYYYNERVASNLYWHDIETNSNHGSTIISASAQIFWGNNGTGKIKKIYDSEAIHEAQYEIWNKYTPTANILNGIKAKFTSKQNEEYVINYNALRDYLHVEVPKFIKGTKTLDSDWTSFCNNLKLKGYQKNVSYLQEIYNKLEG